VKTGKGGSQSWHRKDKEEVAEEKARARQAAEEPWVEAAVWVRAGNVSAQVAERRHPMRVEIPALT